MVRLKDIALKAGVSVMTVSKVLHDAPDISDATKARIRSLAKQMGYVPDSMAQSLRTRATRMFGLVVSAITNPINARIIMALEERSHEMGYDLILAHSMNNPEREETCIRRLLARRVEGLFLMPVYRMEPSSPIYEELLAKKVPTVLIGHKARFCSHFSNVETDDVTASHALTKHLLSLGHQRIAFLSGPTSCPWAVERLDGYKRALRDARIEMDDRLVFHAGATIEEGEKSALQMIHEEFNATAVQAVNDLVAIGAANTLGGQHIQIPEQISLVGFGNTLLSEHFRVPLTTAHQPKFTLGVAAMDSMVKLLGGKHPGTKRLPAEVIIRASTAPPKSPPPAS
jgi:LacI family transcriptional regulator